MRATRWFWTAAATAVVLAIGAAVFARPVLLLGAAGVGAWLVGAQYAFADELARVDDELEVVQELAPARGRTGERFRARLSLRTRGATPLALVATLHPPATTHEWEGDRRCRLDPGERETSARATFTVPVAGTVTFEAPTVVAGDRFGLFEETLERGSTESIAVDPTTPDDVYVGRAGVVVSAFGESLTGRRGTGLDVADVREYTPGDPVNRINWKLSARLGAPHVVDVDTETDLRTLLVVDHRSPLSLGASGRTKLDYNREVALRIKAGVARTSDPLGLYTVGDGGEIQAIDSGASAGHYRAISTALLELDAGAGAGTARRRRRRASGLGTPGTAYRGSDALQGDDSAFGRSVRPFLSDDRPFVERVADDPLAEAMFTIQARERGSLSTLIFTDDSRPDHVRESVQIARRGNSQVWVFLAPTVLFEPGALADAEGAYERYREFEAFRRSLDDLPRVNAFEVAPHQRLKRLRSAATDERLERPISP